MAQSLNSKVDLTIKATSFAGLSTNGNVMVGNKAFEFYNERNVEDCIQIPWDTIDRVEMRKHTLLSLQKTTKKHCVL